MPLPVTPLARPVPAVLERACAGLNYTPQPGTDKEEIILVLRGYLALCNYDKQAGAALWPGREP